MNYRRTKWWSVRAVSNYREDDEDEGADQAGGLLSIELVLSFASRRVGDTSL